jgi:hypothetical protein
LLTHTLIVTENSYYFHHLIPHSAPAEGERDFSSSKSVINSGIKILVVEGISLFGKHGEYSLMDLIPVVPSSQRIGSKERAF